MFLVNDSEMVKTLKPVDPRRIFLTNVPLPIEQELLEIYLEYLSGEENIEVETVHLGDEIRNSILVTYSTSVGKTYFLTYVSSQ